MVTSIANREGGANLLERLGRPAHDLAQALCAHEPDLQEGSPAAQAARVAVQWMLDNSFVRGLDCDACSQTYGCKVRRGRAATPPFAAKRRLPPPPARVGRR